MQSVLHRSPQKNEVLHHIDGNPANNNHDNLIICTQSYHISVFHNKNAERIIGYMRSEAI